MAQFVVLFICLVFLMLMVSFAGRSVAQDRPDPPVDGPPVIMVAQATAKGGDVILKVSNPLPTFKTKTVEVEKDGKKEKVTVAVREYVWSDIEVKVDGKVIAAFDVKGKPIDPKNLLTRLAKAARVAAVLNPPGLNRSLDPYYLSATWISFPSTGTGCGTRRGEADHEAFRGNGRQIVRPASDRGGECKRY